MERPTTEIILPETKARVIFYCYLNTFGAREIKKMLLSTIEIDLKDVKVDGSGKADLESMNLSALSGSLAIDMQNEALKHLVKEVITSDGQTVSDPIAFINDLPEEDGDVVFDKVDQLSKKSRLSETDKKK